jgi:cystathionine beta-lyase/cystathionine gamma-synthase
VSRVNYPGLATRQTKEVVDMHMRGGGRMLSDNFSSSCQLSPQHVFSTENYEIGLG